MPLVLQMHYALCIQHYKLKRFQVFWEPGAYSRAEQLPSLIPHRCLLLDIRAHSCLNYAPLFQTMEQHFID